MFQLITPDKLIIGKKYGIVCKGDDYSGIYKGPVMGCGRQFIVFDKVYDNIEEIDFLCPFYFTQYDIYYEFISDFPQGTFQVHRVVELCPMRKVRNRRFCQKLNLLHDRIIKCFNS
jgi:hypothetical protein